MLYFFYPISLSSYFSRFYCKKSVERGMIEIISGNIPEQIM